VKTALRPQAPKVLWESEISVLFLWEGIDAEPPAAASLLYTTCSDRPRSMPIDRTVFCHTACLVGTTIPWITNKKTGSRSSPSEATEAFP
jgi:hypothetical protein